MYKIILDLVIDDNETIDDAIVALTEATNVDAVDIVATGPTGWPVVTFKAPERNDLIDLIRRYVLDDNDMINDLTPMIVES